MRSTSALGEFTAEAAATITLLDEVVQEISLLGDLYTARADLALGADHFVSPAAHQAAIDAFGRTRDELGTSLADDVDAESSTTRSGGEAPGVESLLSSFDSAWRATGSWRGQPADLSMTVLDAGSSGLWIVDTDRAHDGTTDRATRVRLTPGTVAEVTSKLGDVVTGRTTPPNGSDGDLSGSAGR